MKNKKIILGFAVLLAAYPIYSSNGIDSPEEPKKSSTDTVESAEVLVKNLISALNEKKISPVAKQMLIEVLSEKLKKWKALRVPRKLHGSIRHNPDLVEFSIVAKTLAGTLSRQLEQSVFDIIYWFRKNSNNKDLDFLIAELDKHQDPKLKLESTKLRLEITQKKYDVESMRAELLEIFEETEVVKSQRAALAAQLIKTLQDLSKEAKENIAAFSTDIESNPKLAFLKSARSHEKELLFEAITNYISKYKEYELNRQP